MNNTDKIQIYYGRNDLKADKIRKKTAFRGDRTDEVQVYRSEVGGRDGKRTGREPDDTRTTGRARHRVSFDREDFRTIAGGSYAHANFWIEIVTDRTKYRDQPRVRSEITGTRRKARGGKSALNARAFAAISWRAFFGERVKTKAKPSPVHTENRPRRPVSLSDLSPARRHFHSKYLPEDDDRGATIADKCVCDPDGTRRGGDNEGVLGR